MILPHFTTRSLQGFLAVQTIEGLRTSAWGSCMYAAWGVFILSDQFYSQSY